MITIIDYDAGNIKSVQKAIEFLGKEAVLTNKKEDILNAEKVILPGVGAFGKAVENLEKFDLPEVIKKTIKKGTPFLGICLGLQLLLDSSEESPGVKGLGLIEGKCVKMNPKEGYKIPHMGWNNLIPRKDSRLLSGIKPDAFVYFVHSYYAKASERNDVVAQCEYTDMMDVVFQKDNLFATQFHPEKSSSIGLRILKNFLEL